MTPIKERLTSFLLFRELQEKVLAHIKMGSAKMFGSFAVRQILFHCNRLFHDPGRRMWRLSWVAYDQQLLDSKTTVTNLASSLARDAEATVEIADTMVAGIAVRVETEGTLAHGARKA